MDWFLLLAVIFAVVLAKIMSDFYIREVQKRESRKKAWDDVKEHELNTLRDARDF